MGRLAGEQGETPPEVVKTSEASAPAKENKAGLSKTKLKELKNVEANLRTAEAQCEQAELALADPSIASNAGELSCGRKHSKKRVIKWKPY